MRALILVGLCSIACLVAGCKYGGRVGVTVESPAFGKIAVDTEANKPLK